VQAAALALHQQVVVFDVSSEEEIEKAFTTFVERGVGALFVGGGAFTYSHRGLLVALAARHALPASFSNSESVRAGGLMSYGPSIIDAHRQAGIYVGRILKGEKPADLPVMQSTKFEFLINLGTAKTLGLDVPLVMQMTADEVIE
jgi:putative ABC transport system substrate-binding protein